MKNLYVIDGGVDLLSVVKASNEDEAFNLFAKSKINDPFLKEEIEKILLNAGLFEYFYKDGNGSFFNDLTGDYPKRLLKMNETEREKYIDYHVEKNIREFWRDFPHLAEEYYLEWQKQWYSEIDSPPTFSNEFYKETIKLIILNTNYYDGFNITKIDLDYTNIQYIRDSLD
ncbi:hypothetical protein ACIQZG_01215 [Lysinibacillus sp. NPDC096418]|uniref:hypothetical protein n=1 Tax=Lysinibacillus sp. NPDC096418 TaxID=3364138 RepID=UPI00380B8284